MSIWLFIVVDLSEAEAGGRLNAARVRTFKIISLGTDPICLLTGVIASPTKLYIPYRIKSTVTQPPRLLRVAIVDTDRATAGTLELRTTFDGGGGAVARL